MKITKPFKYFLFIFLITAMVSCLNLKVISSYNQKNVDQILKIQKQVDDFYEGILLETNNNNYDSCKKTYATIISDFNVLYNSNIFIDKNQEFTQNIHIVDSVWRGYVNEHKKYNVLTTAMAKVNKAFMDEYIGNKLLKSETIKNQKP